MYLFSARDIVKKFSNHLALDKVTLNVPEGSVYGLLGPNGAGKTTLLRIINMITAPDTGNLYYSGRPLTQKDIFEIGYLPEERGLYKKMKVGEQSLYLARLKGMSKNDAMQRLKYWFEKFEIQAWWDKKVEELSKGMQQKVQFVTTVIHNPRLLIFDEPFSGFDPINTRLIKREILDLKKKGATIIFSTHDMGSVEELCDHITLINKSKTILEGDIHEIRHSYKSDIYELGFKMDPMGVMNELNGNFEIVGKNVSGTVHYLKIRVNPGFTGNDLLRKILPEIEITSFHEVIPRMNEIFIKVIEAQDKKQS
ncbi:MAG: ATP-binding cassette domain-containing protein [Bacteroidales bacterium]|nr:ATP-binding cassette domain-containing protein [Bacteroidales bacterium]